MKQHQHVLAVLLEERGIWLACVRDDGGDFVDAADIDAATCFVVFAFVGARNVSLLAVTPVEFGATEHATGGAFGDVFIDDLVPRAV